LADRSGFTDHAVPEILGQRDALTYYRALPTCDGHTSVHRRAGSSLEYRVRSTHDLICARAQSCALFPVPGRLSTGPTRALADGGSGRSLHRCVRPVHQPTNDCPALDGLRALSERRFHRGFWSVLAAGFSLRATRRGVGDLTVELIGQLLRVASRGEFADVAVGAARRVRVRASRSGV
jgi:hypothetical protein